MRDAALLVVRHRAAELFLRHFLVRDGLDDVRAGHEHVARVAHHDGEVGDRRRVHGAARAGSHDGGDLRNHSGRQRVAEKNLGVAAEREHAFLDARAARIVQPDDRRAHLHREVHDLDDLRGVGFRERSAENREVLREGIDDAAVDAAVPGNDAIARDDLVGHPEVEAAMCDELVDLFEGVRVEQQVDALARGQLAGRALALEALFAAAELSPPLELVERALRFIAGALAELIRPARPATFPSP